MMNGGDLTGQGERASWSVKHEEVAEELTALMNVSDEDVAHLKALHGAAQDQARSMTDEFYERLFDHDNTKEYFEGHDMSRLHSMIGDWFAELFSGEYGPEYVKDRLQIGKIHVQIGLPVRYPIAMMDVVGKHGEVVTKQSDAPQKAKEAFNKVMALDVAIFYQAYEDNQLKHLSELVGGERLARRLLMG